MRQPNILLIMSDEHDPSYTGFGGHPFVQTPHLNALAQESTIFDAAYCPCPICQPSRMAFLTGKHIHRIAAWGNHSGLASGEQTIGHHLKQAGYQSALCGRMHLDGEDRLAGFDQRLLDDLPKWINHKQNSRQTFRRGSNSHATQCGPDAPPAWLDYDRQATDTACQFVQQQAQETKPWCLVVGLMYPHFPLYCPPEYFHKYYPDKVVLPDPSGSNYDTQHPIIKKMRYRWHNDALLSEEMTRRALASYQGLVDLTDAHVGQLLQALDSSGQADETIVIYTSDHGEMAGRHGIWQKQVFYEPSARVPLLIRSPGATPRCSNQPVNLIDCLPSMRDWAGLDPDQTLDGQSLQSVIDGRDDADACTLSQYHTYGLDRGGYMIRQGPWKYCHYLEGPPQLFHLDTDPKEVHNLADDPAHSEQCAQMLAQLQQHWDLDAIDAAAQATEPQ